MIKNLNYFVSSNGKEYSTDLHIVNVGVGEESTKVMYITVTTLYDGSDYTVIFNGLPTVKNLKRISDNYDAVAPIIDALKEKAVKYAIKYWNFDRDEWEMNLDIVLKQYKESIGIVETDE